MENQQPDFDTSSQSIPNTKSNEDPLASEDKNDPFTQSEKSFSDKEYVADYIRFMFLAVILNNGYVFYLSSSNEVVSFFGYPTLAGMLLTSITLISGTFRYLSFQFFTNIRHKVKIYVVCVLGAITMFTFALAFYVPSKSLGMGLVVLSALFFGMHFSIAEVTVQGFLKAFKPEVVSGYSTGTGIAGIMGGSLYLLILYLGIPF